MPKQLKILSLGTDRSALDKDSKLASRLVEYGELVEKYTVVVPSAKKQELKLSEKVKVYSSGGESKFKQLRRIFQQASQVLCDDQYDLITVQDQYFIAMVAWLLAGKYQIGLEIQNHGWERNTGIRKWLAKFLLPRADVVRTVSERLKKQIHEEHGVNEKKINVVRIFVEVNIPSFSKATAGKNSHGLNTDGHKSGKRFVFLTVGRLVEIKNIGMQITAVKEIISDYPDVELWIVGSGPFERKLKLEIRNLGLENNVKLLGWLEHDKVRELYRKADCFLLTSQAEGWPTVITEAAAAGVPIIMTDVGSAGDLIIDNQSGLIIPVNDKDALVKAMNKIIEDEDLRQRLGKGAREAVLKLPSKEETLELYLKSWEQAARRGE